jgi:hypothetical protein
MPSIFGRRLWTRNMVVLIDANVVLDYVASREPFYRDAYRVMELCASGKVKGLSPPRYMKMYKNR